MSHRVPRPPATTGNWAGPSPGACRGSTALPTPSSQTFSLQNGERSDFCYFKPFGFVILCHSSHRKLVYRLSTLAHEGPGWSHLLLAGSAHLPWSLASTHSPAQPSDPVRSVAPDATRALTQNRGEGDPPGGFRGPTILPDPLHTPALAMGASWCSLDMPGTLHPGSLKESPRLVQNSPHRPSSLCSDVALSGDLPQRLLNLQTPALHGTP